MSIWVRLIGGDHNGRVIKIDDDQLAIPMHEQLSLSYMRTHRNFGLAPASFELKITSYTRRTVKPPGGDIIFFAPEEMSDFEALQSVLGP